MPSLTLGVVAHVDAGKTSLTERLLFETGASSTLGSVDAGTTRTDSMDLERRRGITIRAAVTGFALGDLTVTVVDTPGHPDFIAEVERSIGVLDAAILVVSAVEGVQSQTVQIWRALARAGIPALIFVNKTDRAGADTAAVVAQIHEHLTEAAVPVTRVEHEGTAHAAVHPLDPTGDEVVEALAVRDDRILRRWAENRPVPARLVDQVLWRDAVAVPVLAGSALTGAGLDPLLAAIARLPRAGADAGGPVAATTFAIDRDAGGQRRTWVRVWKGNVVRRCRLSLAGREPQLVTGLWVSTAEGLRPTHEIRAGQVGAVVGLSRSRIGDDVGSGSPRPAQHFPPATVRALVEPVEAAQRTRAFQALQELADEDPLIALELSEADQEAAVSLYGEVQQEVIAAVLEERFGVRVRFSGQSVLCIERVIGTGNATETIGVAGNPYLAGLGLRVEPLPENSGILFSPGIERGRLPTAFIAATEEGVRQSLRAGRSGWAVTDCRITMTASAYCPRQSRMHEKFNKSVSTVAGDFRHLAPSVVHQALARAGTGVCHPVDRFELEVPEAALPAVLTTLGRLGARVGDARPTGRSVVLHGSMPSGRVPGLSRALPGLSSGHGILTTEFSCYARSHDDPAPVRPRRGPDPADRLTWFRAHPR
ncbi:TetM/TetW/TetO/TetS family tetracycline resistance ribosomal protection protein [Kineosporia sp. J2-2]|uniref:TetM/TetW/TetO/TetS family tetracycline resistance ribosomal protection protein n=1 Tax=Kineosporia corallincola TaxID=2835133 RepID=A0ABS5TEI4_9ACTN|nr:TetM/TetW/TetO/TetS family tetracycline resistance ribosomal protection protein [Kineosporia corallincola]MBT0769497.1 TetM/TetW/TetO/TetS family tetracycline resistance ribosomal protection protein [Kineosporia corallincola]